MTPNQTRNFAGSAAQFFLGGLALALVTLAFHQIHADIATTAFADLVVILLFSLIGSFVAAVLLCLLSVASLVYFFAPPVFSFVVDDPRHIVIVAAFCVTAVMVAWLIGTARQEKEVAQEAEAKLRRSQVELRNSERQWREVFEHNPVMYFMVDADGTVLNVNTFGAAQLGYAVAELVGKSVLNVFLEEDRAFVRKCVAVCLETAANRTPGRSGRSGKTARCLWVRENAKAMRRADDKLIVLVACEDITERKRDRTCPAAERGLSRSCAGIEPHRQFRLEDRHRRDHLDTGDVSNFRARPRDQADSSVDHRTYASGRSRRSAKDHRSGLPRPEGFRA